MAHGLTYEMIKQKIKHLHHTHPDIHVNVKQAHSKVNLLNVPARIVELYEHIFVLVELSKGYEQKHAIKYSDVLIGNIEIVEFFGNAEA